MPVRGRSVAESTRSSHTAARQPTTPPAADSTRLSVRNCRRIRLRPAPIAIRIETSRRCCAPRSRSRIARLLQTSASTRPTTPINNIGDRNDHAIEGRMNADRAGGQHFDATSLIETGEARGQTRGQTVHRCPRLRYRHAVTEARSNHEPVILRPLERLRRKGALDRAHRRKRQPEVDGDATRESRCTTSGPMPTIVTDEPPKRRVRPTMPGSEPKRVRHARSLTTATVPAAGRSSSGAIQRPLRRTQPEHREIRRGRELDERLPDTEVRFRVDRCEEDRCCAGEDVGARRDRSIGWKTSWIAAALRRSAGRRGRRGPHRQMAAAEGERR